MSPVDGSTGAIVEKPLRKLVEHLIDVRKLNRIIALTDTGATAEGGALQGDVDRAARERGREMTILPTPFTSATMAGWVAGAHLGLGGTSN